VSDLFPTSDLAFLFNLQLEGPNTNHSDAGVAAALETLHQASGLLG
jgi:hypothetical protein